MNRLKKQSELKVLYFGPLGIRGGIGGSARLKNMLDVLRKLGTKTTLISYLPENKFKISHLTANKSLNAVIIQVNNSYPTILKIPALLLLFIYGIRHAGKSAIIFSHSPSTTYGLPAFLLTRLFRKPFLIDLTDARDNNTPASVYRFILGKANVVLAVSTPLVAVAEKANCKYVLHVPGFIDTSTFIRKDSERSRIREELKIPADAIVVGYAGAFSPDEGLETLIAAFGRLSSHYGNIRLMLLGGGNAPGGKFEISPIIEALGIRNKVIVVSPRPYEEMPTYLSVFDIGCSPKLDIPVNRSADPIKVYEYMSVGLLVVASALGETTHVIENGIDGFLTKPGDVYELAQVLESIMQNIGSLNEVRRKARQKVIDKYSQEAAAGKIQQILQTLVKSKK